MRRSICRAKLNKFDGARAAADLARGLIHYIYRFPRRSPRTRSVGICDKWKWPNRSRRCSLVVNNNVPLSNARGFHAVTARTARRIWLFSICATSFYYFLESFRTSRPLRATKMASNGIDEMLRIREISEIKRHVNVSRLRVVYRKNYADLLDHHAFNNLSRCTLDCESWKFMLHASRIF